MLDGWVSGGRWGGAAPAHVGVCAEGAVMALSSVLLLLCQLDAGASNRDVGRR